MIGALDGGSYERLNPQDLPTNFINNRAEQICGYVDLALTKKYPNSPLPAYSASMQEVFGRTWTFAQNMENSKVTRDHLIVALLRGPHSIKMAEPASGYDDKALLAGALAGISNIDHITGFSGSPVVFDPNEDEASDDEIPSSATFLDWVRGAADLAIYQNEQLYPKHFEAFAANKTLRGSLRRVAAVGRPLKSLSEWTKVKRATYRARDAVLKKFDRLPQTKDFTAPINALDQSVRLELREVCNKIAMLERTAGAKTIDFKPLIGELTSQIMIANRATVEEVRKIIPLTAPDYQLQLEGIKQQIGEIPRPYCPPSARRMALLIACSLATGGALGILISFLGGSR
jgi:hypothetical protein